MRYFTLPIGIWATDWAALIGPTIFAVASSALRSFAAPKTVDVLIVAGDVFSEALALMDCVTPSNIYVIRLLHSC